MVSYVRCVVSTLMTSSMILVLMVKETGGCKELAVAGSGGLNLRTGLFCPVQRLTIFCNETEDSVSVIPTLMKVPGKDKHSSL